MSTNPYEAPQTTPPTDLLRVYRWVGTFFLFLSGFVAMASVIMFVGFIVVLHNPRPGQTSNSFLFPAISNLGMATGLFFAGRYFRRKGRRPLE